MTASPVLARIADGDLCSGCGLCSGILEDDRLTMGLDDAGFLRPRQEGPLTPQEDALIAAVCPGLTLRQTPAEATFHPIWGPVIKVRVGQARDPDLRFQGSSGGALSALSLFLVESGRVSAVHHNAACEADPLGNRIQASKDRGGLLAGAGSRYSPSAPLADIGRRLNQRESFAFIGKPCDVAGLGALARQDPRIDAKIPLKLSFFCAGVPSLRGAQEILRSLDVREEDLAAFRYRGHGWPGAATAIAKDGGEASMSYARSWGGVLSKHLQFRCKICPDGNGGFADVACGDPWYEDESGLPSFEEQDGRSLIVTRTAAGERLVLDAMDAGYLDASEIDSGEIARMQPYQARRKGLIASRLAALWIMGRPRPRYHNLNLWAAARLTSPWQHLRSFLGTLRRLTGKPS